MFRRQLHDTFSCCALTCGLLLGVGCAGVLEAGSYALNSNKGKKERIGRLMLMHANNREDIKTAFAGDIVAIGGLKDIVTGTCLSSSLVPWTPPPTAWLACYKDAFVCVAMQIEILCTGGRGKQLRSAGGTPLLLHHRQLTA